MIKICFLSTKHTPFDKRVFEKEAKTLAEAGFTVFHLAPSKDHQHPFERSGVSIIPLKPVAGIMTRLGQLSRTFQNAKHLNADCYHCNEVDSWFIGVLLKLSCRKKVVFDVHEHYPSNFAESRFPKFLRPVVEYAIRLLFRLLLPFTDRIVLAKQSVSEDFPRSESKQVLVRNFAPKYCSITQRSESKSWIEPIKIVHLGLFSKIRGWPQFLDALDLVSKKLEGRRLEVNVIGEINDGTQQEFTERIRSLNTSLDINLYNWMPYEQAFSLLLESWVGVILFQPGPKNHTHSFPHKLFDYMRAGMAVIAPRFAIEVSEIILSEKCGLLVDPSSSSSIADAILRLLTDEKLCSELGSNGQKGIQERLNWEKEGEKLIAMYSELAKQINNKSQVKPINEKQMSCAA